MITRTGRGRAVWQHLAALVVVPLLATTALSLGVVRSHLDQVERTATARTLLADSLELDAARRAVDDELLPALALALALDEEASGRAGLSPVDRGRLLQTGPEVLAAARAATDRALAAVGRGGDAAVAASVERRLRSLRVVADDGSPSLQEALTGYLAASDALRLAETRASVRASSAGLTGRSAPSSPGTPAASCPWPSPRQRWRTGPAPWP